MKAVRRNTLRAPALSVPRPVHRVGSVYRSGIYSGSAEVCANVASFLALILFPFLQQRDHPAFHFFFRHGLFRLPLY